MFFDGKCDIIDEHRTRLGVNLFSHNCQQKFRVSALLICYTDVGVVDAMKEKYTISVETITIVQKLKYKNVNVVRWYIGADL